MYKVSENDATVARKNCLHTDANTGYPHDSCADKNPYWHSPHVDKRRYRHKRNIRRCIAKQNHDLFSILGRECLFSIVFNCYNVKTPLTRDLRLWNRNTMPPIDA